jgi:hypothetical protein
MMRTLVLSAAALAFQDVLCIAFGCRQEITAVGTKNQGTNGGHCVFRNNHKSSEPDWRGISVGDK